VFFYFTIYTNLFPAFTNTATPGADMLEVCVYPSCTNKPVTLPFYSSRLKLLIFIVSWTNSAKKIINIKKVAGSSSPFNTNIRQKYIKSLDTHLLSFIFEQKIIKP
jgi:hypothetical protein